MNINNIKLNPDNPRIIKDDKFYKLVESIKNFPKMMELRPIIIDENNIILGGNMRLRALQELGYAEIPNNWVKKDTELSENEKKQFIIKDNVSFGEWDFDMLANQFELDELKEWGLDNIDEYFDDFKKTLDNDEIKEDELPDIPKKSNIKRGDIIILGNHKIMCGDSINEDDVKKLMNDKKIDMSFNDPPYGMKKEKQGIKNDNLNFDDLLKFNISWINLQWKYLKDNASFYCWGIDEPLMDIYSNIIKPLIKKQKATFRNLITWDKGNGQGQLSEEFRSYAKADEKCLFIMCGVQGFNNNADNYFDGWESIRNYLLQERKKANLNISTMKKIAGHSYLSRDHWTSKSQWTMLTKKTYILLQNYCKENNIDAFKKEYDELKKEYDELKKEYDELKKEYYLTRAYFNNTHDNMNNVWHFKRINKYEKQNIINHATPKPITLCIRAIKSSSRENEIILDMFLGSGSTLIACEQTNRICYGMEIDEIYCQVIIDRYINFKQNNGDDVYIIREEKEIEYKNIEKIKEDK